MHLVRKERRFEGFDRRALGLTGEREPNIPPRVTNAEAEIISRQISGIEEERIESVGRRAEFTVFIIDPPRKGDAPFKPIFQTVGDIRMFDELAIVIDDAGEAGAAVADGREDSADARLSVGRQRGEIKAKVELTQRFGFLWAVYRHRNESARAP